jgi:hypothetical protein
MRKGSKKLKIRGNNYYCEPFYKIPDELPLKIVFLALIAKKRECNLYEILGEWKLFVPHPNAYDMMARYAKALIGFIRRIERGRYEITKAGWKKLKYYDVKLKGLPEVLRKPIAHILESIEL